MVRSAAKTADEYVSELPEDRREVVATVRKLIRKSLPKGYEESVNWGMLSYEIPLSRYSGTYNKQPIGYVALAAQKNNYALYLMSASMDPARNEALKEAFAQAGKKMDMGKSCLLFKKLDDLPLDAISQFLSATPPEKLIEHYEAAHPPKKKKE